MIIVKVPSSQGSLERNLGCELAPDVLAEKIKNPKLRIDAVAVVQSDIEETDRRIYEKAREIFSGNEKAVFLGGDHSITYSIFRAFSENYENPALIVFDAHADSMKGIRPVSHEDMNRELIGDGLLKKEDLLIAGMRRVWRQEKEFLAKNKIAAITAKGIRENLNSSVYKLQDFVLEKKNIYLSIDIDVFDPSIAPGTGYLERNGLNEREFDKLFETVMESRKVKALDLVEVNPKKDAEGKTIAVAGRIMKKIIH